MSLHIANLTHRTRKDEIERVFRRFGRCSVDLRNGYGFVVYDLQADAEMALRSLKGKKICGESIYLSWSKEQPKPLHKFVTEAKTRQVQYGRRSGNGVNDVHHNVSRDQNHYSVRDRHPNDRRGTHKSTELHNDRSNFKCSNMGVERYDQRQEDKKGNDFNDHMRLDRYDPKNGDERHEGYRNIDLGPLAGSPTRKTSLVDNKIVHHRDNIRSRRGCFRCGEVGHKMRDCPLEDASQGKSLNHSDRSPDNQVNTIARVGDGVGARLQSRRRSSTSARRHEADRKSLIVENNEVKGSSSLVLSQSMGNTRKNYSRKRQREKESQSLEVHNDKKSKILSMPPSSHNSPELRTHASREVFLDSTVLSKPQSPVSHFCSGSSMTKSRSNQSRSTSIRSKSRSRSRSPNSAFLVSLNQDLSPSPISSELSAGVPNPQSKELPFEVGEQLHPEVREEGLSVANIGDASLNVTLENDQVPHSENVAHEEGKLCDPDLTQVLKHQITDMSVENEPVSISDEVKGDVQIDQLHNLDNDNLKEVKAPNPSLLELGDNSITAREIGLEKQKKNEELENANTFEVPKSPGPANNVDSKAPMKLHKKLCISKENLVRVMKQYGLKELEIDEQYGRVEDYFGSARLWPWEIIYYRRLKKGLISTENYAKRVAQNNTFGITDKYIRSSSGWGELFDEHV